MNDIDRRVVHALQKGPLYRPTLEVILGISEKQSRACVQRLTEKGLVEIARDIGPATYRLTEAGRST